LTQSGGSLHGTVVLDLSRALAGPHAAMLLGDLGARVIKVEQPGSGDDTRGWGPPFVGPEDEPVSTYFLSCNRNKESLELDLKSEEGRDLLTRLLRVADVVVENFRPGVLERLGFAPQRMHELNPRLVICSITGFGGDGPEGGRAGYDQIAQGEAGLMSITGPGPGEPTKVGVPIGDLLSGLHAAYGVLAIVLSAVLSPFLHGELQGPLANPFAVVSVLITNALWGALSGGLARGAHPRRRARQGGNWRRHERACAPAPEPA
jgi:crotonobetainyl-CoA:carnitine CoA-transferase CaiB-like acyl-CoA transferase